MGKEDTVTLSKSDLRSRDKKITEQQSAITKLQEELEALKESKDNPAPSERPPKPESVFTNEDKEDLGELYDPLKRLIDSSLTPIRNETATQIEQLGKGITKNFSSLKSDIANQNKNLFSGVASSTLKNFDDIKGTEEFEEFLDKEIVGVGILWRDAWADAEKKNDITRMQEIVDQVPRPSAEGTENEAESSPKRESNFEPQGGTSDSEMNVSTDFKFKASDMDAKIKAYNRGEIDIEEYEEFEKSFNEAIDNSQVLNDIDAD